MSDSATHLRDNCPLDEPLADLVEAAWDAPPSDRIELCDAIAARVVRRVEMGVRRLTMDAYDDVRSLF